MALPITTSFDLYDLKARGFSDDDEVNVIGTVTNEEAWRVLEDVKASSVVADGPNAWLVTGTLSVGKLNEVKGLAFVTSLKVADAAQLTENTESPKRFNIIYLGSSGK